MDFVLPTLIDDRYLLRQLLGRGGSSYVYRATDELIKREVALKIHANLGARDGAWTYLDKRSFFREAKVAASLKHQNVASIYAVGVFEDRPYLVMELVEGKSLAAHILSEGPMPVQQALEVMEQLCAGVQYLHDHGIIHRDIKPDNVMLMQEEDRLLVKVIDLGLAKRTMKSAQALTMTAPGTVVGTPSYMSPEQICCGKLDARSDVFALGAVLYESVTGLRAFAKDDQLSEMKAILEQDPEPMSEICPQLLIPAAIENIALTALSKDPNVRYATVSDMLVNVSAVRSALLQGKPLPEISRPQCSSYKWDAGAKKSVMTPAIGQVLSFAVVGAILVAAATALLMMGNPSLRYQIESVMVDINPASKDSERFKIHSELQNQYYQQWIVNPQEATRAKVIEEGKACRRYFEGLRCPLEIATVMLRSLNAEGSAGRPQDLEQIGNCLTLGIEQTRGKNAEQRVWLQLKEIDHLIENFDQRYHCHLVDRLLVRPVELLIVQNRNWLALQQAQELLSADELLDPSSPEIVYANVRVAHAALLLGEPRVVQKHLDLALVGLLNPKKFHLISSRQATLWLQCAVISHGLYPAMYPAAQLDNAERLATDPEVRWEIQSTRQAYLRRPH